MLGFEPRQRASETPVLPLHYIPIFGGVDGDRTRDLSRDRRVFSPTKLQPQLAESTGFEPVVVVTPRQVSNLLLSATQPTLHDNLVPDIGVEPTRQ